MQARAMALMGRKLAASQALEGKFSSEGLVAMSGEDEGIEMALAKSLAEQMDHTDATAAWKAAGARVSAEEPAPIILPMPGVKADERSLTGKEVVDLMKKCKATIKAWAEQFQVSEYRVRVWRKSGVPGDLAGTVRAGARSAAATEKKPRAGRVSSKRGNGSPA
jgi:hypothetical protein